MDQAERVQQQVASKAEEFLDQLKEACSIPSISTEGRGTDEMAAWLQDRLEGLGAQVSKLEVPDAPAALVGDLAGSGPGTLMIYDHYDVQPVDPLELWESPPFEPTERDGRIFARGTADNKGDLVARLSAIDVYRELYGDPPFSIKFFVEGEEETGSPHFEDICKKHSQLLQADHCIWEGAGINGGGRPLIYFGCKGLLYIELTCKALSSDQHSSIAVYAPAAAWRLVDALSSLRDESGTVVIEGFHDDIAEPGKRELELAMASDFDEAGEKKRLGADGFVDGLTGAELKRALYYRPTANIAGFSSGYTVEGAAKTVLPAGAMAKMDFRLVPDQDPIDLAEKLRTHLDRHGFEDIEMKVLGAEHPSQSPIDTVLGDAVTTVSDAWFGKKPDVLPLMFATGPMYPIAQVLGVPICSPPGVWRPDSEIHAPNERVRIDDYLGIVGFTVEYLRKYGELVSSQTVL